jgi:hypothetical protein
MATFKVPQNAGKVRVAVTTGNRYVVWNGKHGRYEFSIPCKDRKQAEAIARLINTRQHGGEINTLAI